MAPMLVSRVAGVQFNHNSRCARQERRTAKTPISVADRVPTVRITDVLPSVRSSAAATIAVQANSAPVQADVSRPVQSIAAHTIAHLERGARAAIAPVCPRVISTAVPTHAARETNAAAPAASPKTPPTAGTRGFVRGARSARGTESAASPPTPSIAAHTTAMRG
jgi:hypothetical protein